MPIRSATVLLLAACLSVGCSTAPKSEKARATLEADARNTLARFADTNPAVFDLYANRSAGVAVFPTVGKGGAGIGGAYGRGVLIQDNAVTGYCDLTQASIGLQLGGQAYSEIIFFEGTQDVTDFTAGNFELSAQASAVALTADASATTDYDNGVAVFTLAGRGLMYEASIAGQKFSFVPVQTPPAPRPAGARPPKP